MTYEWLAGFFDGDGCIGIYKRRKWWNYGYYRLLVRIEQRDNKILERIKDFIGFGRVIYRRKKTNVSLNTYVYRLELSLEESKKLLIRILPYLELRSVQVRFALQFEKYKQKGKPLSQKEIKFREMHAKLIFPYYKNLSL